MSKQTKIIAAIGALLIAGAAAFYFVASKPPAPQAERGFAPH